MNDFFNFIIEILPERYDIEVSNLITFRTIVKRDPGMFQSWKNSILLITIQNNLYLFDKRIMKDFNENIGLNSFYFKKKNDKKSEMKLQLNETKKGILFKSNISIMIEACGKESYDEIIKVFISYQKQGKVISSGESKKNEELNANNINTD